MEPFIKKIKSFKLFEKDKMLIGILFGILLFVIAIPTGKKEEKAQEKPKTAAKTEAKGEEDSVELLEKRLAAILNRVDGVGEVEVMITKKASSEKVIEKDIPTVKNNLEETDSTGGNRSSNEEETNEETVYSTYSDGSKVPYVTKEIEPEIEGVLVIAEGGDNPVVKQNISEAVQALFHIEAHKIKVMKRIVKERGGKGEESF